jgi:hypothetical protein
LSHALPRQRLWPALGREGRCIAQTEAFPDLSGIEVALVDSRKAARSVNHARCLRRAGLPCESVSARQPHRDPRASGSRVLFTAVDRPLHPYSGAEPFASSRVVLRLPRIGRRIDVPATGRFLTLVRPRCACCTGAETAVRGNHSRTTGGCSGAFVRLLPVLIAADHSRPFTAVGHWRGRMGCSAFCWIGLASCALPSDKNVFPRAKRDCIYSTPEDRIGRRIPKAMPITEVSKRFVSRMLLSIQVRREFPCRDGLMFALIHSHSNGCCQFRYCASHPRNGSQMAFQLEIRNSRADCDRLVTTQRSTAATMIFYSKRGRNSKRLRCAF